MAGEVQVPVIIPTGEGLETIGFFSHSDGHGFGPNKKIGSRET